jgi:hypothetical protein
MATDAPENGAMGLRALRHVLQEGIVYIRYLQGPCRPSMLPRSRSCMLPRSMKIAAMVNNNNNNNHHHHNNNNKHNHISKNHNKNNIK